MENSTCDSFVSSSTGCEEADRNTIRISSALGIAMNAVLLAFGAPGNCLILRVHWKKKRKTSTHILIMGLALADLLVCLSLMGEIVLSTFTYVGRQKPKSFDLFGNVINIWVGVSVGLTGLIAVDRYDCVCRPHRKWFNNRRAKMLILAAMIPSVLAEAPLMVCTIWSCQVSEVPSWALDILGLIAALFMIVVCYGKVYMTIRRHVKVGISARWGRETSGMDRSTNGQQLRVIEISNSSKPDATRNMTRKSSATPVNASPSEDTSCTRPCRTALNAIRTPAAQPIVEASASAARPTQIDDTSINSAAAKHLPEKTTRFRPPGTNVLMQRKTTRMLFVTSVVFVLSWVPFWVAVAVSFFGDIKDQNVSYVVDYFSPQTYFVNNAINPLIYSLANRRFRDDCVQELRKLWRLCRD